MKILLKTNNANKKSTQKQETLLSIWLNFCHFKYKTNNINLFLNVQDYTQEDSYPSYDWFASTIFLLYEGNLNSSFKFLYNFYHLQMSAFIWSVRLYSNESLLSSVYNKNGIKTGNTNKS